MALFQDRSLTVRVLLVVILMAALNLSPRSHELRKALNQARVELIHSNLPVVFTQLRNASEHVPWRYDLAVFAARYALQIELPLHTIQILERPGVASRLNPDDLVVLGDAYQQSGDIYMAAAIWQRVIELAPSPDVYQRLADYHLSQADYPAAIEDLRHVLQYQPSKASLNYRIGLLYSTIEPETALAYLAQAAELDSALASGAQDLQRQIRTARLFEEPAYTFTTVGRALALLDEWDLAEASFMKATQLRPDYAEAWAFLGEARQHSTPGGFTNMSGLAELQRAVQLDPQSISANLLMGLYLTRRTDYQSAIQYIHTALTIEPGNPLLHAESANVLAQAGDLPAAQAAYQQAISLAPGDPLFYRLLAEFCLMYGVQVRETGLPAARMAAALAPQDPRTLDVIAQSLLLLEDELNAERFIIRALEIDPVNAPAHLHLGMIYIQQGDMERGRHEFDLAKRLGSDSFASTQAQQFISYYYP